MLKINKVKMEKLHCIDYVNPNHLFYEDGRLNIRHVRCRDEECFKTCLTLILSFGGKIIDLYFGNVIEGKISDMSIPLIVDKDDWYNNIK